MALHYSAVEKIKGGKTVSIDVWVENDLIAKVKLTGDFFMHPEEQINVLERVFEGAKVKFDWIELERKLMVAIQDNDIQLVGVGTGSILSVLRKASSGEPKND